MKKKSVAPTASPSRTKSGTTAGKKRVTFSLSASPQAKVAVAGTFSNWQEMEMSPPKAAGAEVHSRVLYLSPGTYEYKFVLDGHWITDPLCQECAPNSFGADNSLIRVG